MLDLYATRLVALFQASSLVGDDRDLAIYQICAQFCRAATAYGHAIEASPGSPRAVMQLHAYGPGYGPECRWFGPGRVERDGAVAHDAR